MEYVLWSQLKLAGPERPVHTQALRGPAFPSQVAGAPPGASALVGRVWLWTLMAPAAP